MAHRGRPCRAGARATHRVELLLTDREYGYVRRLAKANNCTLADCLRLGVFSLAEEAGGPAPPIMIGGVLQSFAIINRA